MNITYETKLTDIINSVKLNLLKVITV